MLWGRYLPGGSRNHCLVSARGTIDVEGIGIEFEQRAKAMGGTQKESQSLSEALDAEMFKYVADTLVRESGAEPVLHCLAVEPLIDGDTINGVVVESKSGRQAILAQRVVDATGDADMAHRAGAPCRKTPVQEMMGVTVMFSCSGVNKQRFLDYVRANPSTYKDWGLNWGMETDGKEDDLFSPYLEEPFDRARQAGVIPESMKSIAGTWGRITDGGEATCLNMVFMSGLDCTDVKDLTRAEMEGRHEAILAIEALRRFAPDSRMLD